MSDASKNKEQQQDAGPTPSAGNPGDGAGRIEVTGSRHAGVWPASGPPPDNPDVLIREQASFGQGARGAAGYEDSGQSEVFPIPPDDETESAAGTESGP